MDTYLSTLNRVHIDFNSKNYAEGSDKSTLPPIFEFICLSFIKCKALHNLAKYQVKPELEQNAKRGGSADDSSYPSCAVTESVGRLSLEPHPEPQLNIDSEAPLGIVTAGIEITIEKNPFTNPKTTSDSNLRPTYHITELDHNSTIEDLQQNPSCMNVSINTYMLFVEEPPPKEWTQQPHEQVRSVRYDCNANSTVSDCALQQDEETEYANAHIPMDTQSVFDATGMDYDGFAQNSSEYLKTTNNPTHSSTKCHGSQNGISTFLYRYVNHSPLLDIQHEACSCSIYTCIQNFDWGRYGHKLSSNTSLSGNSNTKGDENLLNPPQWTLNPLYEHEADAGVESGAESRKAYSLYILVDYISASSKCTATEAYNHI